LAQNGVAAFTGYYGGFFKQGSIGRRIFDPMNLLDQKKGPPKVEPPPPPPDTTASMLREISRAQTDAEIRKSKRQSMLGGY
jgi:hypothetical protein